MNKAILIGNGFTSFLIKEYSNNTMMELMIEKLGSAYSIANSKFDSFRFSHKSKDKLYKYGGGTYCGDGLFCSEQTYLMSDYLIYDNEAKVHIINTLESLGFNNPNEICEKYFLGYGLIYEVNKQNISNVENLLKIVNMFCLIGLFSSDDEKKIILVANEIYYNNGNYGLKDTSLTSYSKIKSFFVKFEFIFTTNYDLVLDDICNNRNKVYHLHGGFNIEHQNTKSNKRLNNKEAFLVWGINGEDKYNKLSPGHDFNHIDFNDYRFGQSLLADYFDELQIGGFQELHIFGYSGENDQHINQRLVMNKNLENIYFYCNPANEVDNYDFECKIKDLFKSDRITVKLKPWIEIWNNIL